MKWKKYFLDDTRKRERERFYLNIVQGYGKAEEGRKCAEQ